LRRLFGTSGIRGIFGENLDAIFAIKLGYAISRLLPKKVVIGWDCRTSSKILSYSLASAIASCNITVDMAGLVTTPALQTYVTYTERYDYGIMVTASHNPPQYNGFKVFLGSGLESYPDTEEKIEKALEEKVNIQWDSVGAIQHLPDKHVCKYYVDKVLEHYVNSSKWNVGVDLAGCASIFTIPYLLERLEVNSYYINDTLDPLFKLRPPEPRPDNLGKLQQLVQSKKLDFGVAFDGDGDRAIFVDEKGIAWWGDATGILIGKYLVEIGETKYVVTPITSTIATEIVIENVGGKVIRTKVGGKNIVKEMINHNSVWGFEENGGGIYGKHVYGRDGGITLVLILRILKHYNKPLSRLLGELPKYHQVKDKVMIKDKRTAELLIKHLYNKFSKFKIDTTEGVKIFFKDDEWVLVRPSGTEPIIRIFGESKSRKRAEEMVLEMKKEIYQFLDK